MGARPLTLDSGGWTQPEIPHRGVNWLQKT
jgi:hypothetical protein